MAQQIDIPGVGLVEFPDSMTEEQITAAARKLHDEANPREQKGMAGSFTGGMSRAWEGTKGLVTEALPAMFQAATGQEEAARKNLELYRGRTEAAERANPTQVDFKDLVNDFTFDKLGRFAAESFGEAIPSMATALVPGVGGGALAARIAGGAALKEAAGAGSALAARQLAKRIAAGEAAGAVVGSGVQNIPESFAQLNENPEQELSVGPAFIAGALKTALDAYTPIRALRTLKGPEVADEVATGLVGRFLQSKKGAAVLEAAKTLAVEGGTEGLQEFIDQVASNVVRGEDFDPWKIAGAAAKGGIGAAPFGAVTGAVNAGKAQDLRAQAASELEDRTRGAREIEIQRQAAQADEGNAMALALAKAQAGQDTANAEAEKLSSALDKKAASPEEVAVLAAMAGERATAEGQRQSGPTILGQENAPGIRGEMPSREILIEVYRPLVAERLGVDPAALTPEVIETYMPPEVRGDSVEISPSAEPVVATETPAAPAAEVPAPIDNITRNAVETLIAETPKGQTLSVPAIQRAVQEATGKIVTPGEAKRIAVEVGGEKYAKRFGVSPNLVRREAPKGTTQGGPFVGREELPAQGPSYAGAENIEPRPADMTQAPLQNLPRGISAEKAEAWTRAVEAMPAGTKINFLEMQKEGLVRTPQQQRAMVDWAKGAGLLDDKGIRIVASDRVRSEKPGRPFVARESGNLEAAEPLAAEFSRESPRPGFMEIYGEFSPIAERNGFSLVMGLDQNYLPQYYVSSPEGHLSVAPVHALGGATISAQDKAFFLQKRDENEQRLASGRRSTASPLAGRSVVVGEGVNESLGQFAGEFLRSLGQNAPRLVIVRSDKLNSVRGLESWYPASRNAQALPPASGALLPVGRDTYVLVMPPSRGRIFDLEVLTHELGHAIEKNMLSSATPAEIQAIEADYIEFVKNTKGLTARQHVELLRASRTSSARSRRNSKYDYSNEYLSDYWFSFSEWFADQTAKWATTQQKPLSLVEKFFSRLGQVLKSLYAMGRKKGLPAPSIEAFLNNRFRNPLLPGARPSSPLQTAKTQLSRDLAETPGPTRLVLQQEEAAVKKDEKVAALVGLVDPYVRSTEQLIRGDKIFTPPPVDSTARLAWWNKWLNTLDYLGTKYKEMAGYAQVMSDRSSIAQALRRSFIELMHPMAQLKTKKNVNSFAIFADALGHEGAKIEKAGEGLVLRFDPQSLPESSYLRKVAPASGVITLNKEEAFAYNKMREAYNLEHQQVRQSLLARYGLPAGVTREQLDDLAKRAGEAAKLIEDPVMRKQAEQRARNATRIAEILRDDFDAPGFLSHYLPHVRPQGDKVVEFTATGPDGQIQYYRVDSPVGLWDAKRRAKTLKEQVAKRLGADWKLSDLAQSTPNSVISQFRQSRDISSFNTVEALVSLLKTGANEDMIDSFLGDLAKLRKEVSATGTTSARRMFRKGIEGYVHEGNFDRYVEQVAADVLSRSAASIARNYTSEAHSEVLASLAHLPDKSFVQYAQENSDYVDSSEHSYDALRAMAFHYTLGTSISSAMLNLMQVAQTTLPVLGSIYGFGKTSSALMKAYGDVTKMLKLGADPDFILGGDKRPPGIEPRLWRDFQLFLSRSGATPIMTDQMGGIRGGQNLKNWEAVAGAKAEQLAGLASYLFSTAEQVNRAVTFIAAWRLAEANKGAAAKHRNWAGDSSFIGPEAQKMTTGDIAAFTVDQTQYNMSKAMRPKFMQGVLGVPFQFSAYPIRTMELMAKAMFARGGKGMWNDPVARKMLISLLGMVWLQAGLLGMPVVGAGAEWWDEIFAEKLSKMLGRPVPEIRKSLQEGIAQLAKEMQLFDDPAEAANFILKGPLRQVTGAAVESRVALDWPRPDMLSGNPLAALGPFGGAVGGGIANFGEFQSRGLTMLAISQLLPPMFRNYAKAEAASPSAIGEALGIPPQGLGILGPSGKSPLGPEEVDKSRTEYGRMLMGFTSVKTADAREALRSIGSQQVTKRKDELLDNLSNDLVTAILFEKAGDDKRGAEARKRFEDKLQAALAQDAEQTDPQKKLLVGDIGTALKSRVVERLFPVQSRLKAAPKATRGAELENLQTAYGAMRP